MEGTLKRHPSVVIDAPIGNHRIVHCESTRQYYRLGLLEGAFFEALDGSHSAAELRAANAQGFTHEQVNRLLEWFSDQQLLDDTARLEREVKTTWATRLWAFILRPDQFRLTLFNPEHLLNSYSGVVDVLFSRVATAMYTLIMLSPAIVYIANPKITSGATHSLRPLSGTDLMILYLAMFVVNFLHEFAHAIACKHFGGRVDKIGLMFLYITPVIYCDVSDTWRFPSTNQKVIVTLAGIFLQFLLSALGLAFWLLTGSTTVLYFVIVNTGIALFNFFPFIKLDGYWMLVHLVDEPNLKAKSMTMLRHMLQRLLRRNNKLTIDSSNQLIAAYGIGHLLAIPLFWSMGLYGLYSRLSHVSPVLAVLVVSLFGGAFLYRVGKSMIGLMQPIS